MTGSEGDWQTVPKRIDYRARLAFETIIGTKLDAELGQRLWDAMLANSPVPSAAGPQDIATAPRNASILVWYPSFGWMNVGHAEWWTWERKPTHWMPEPPPPRKPGPPTADAEEYAAYIKAQSA